MSVDNFELLLATRMKTHASELDRSLRPAPRLQMLLAAPVAAGSRVRGMVRFGLGVAAALALALFLVSGSLLLGSLPQVQPPASITPTPVTSVAPSQTPSSAPASRASPTSTASYPAPLAIGLLEPSR
jgi:hypothetical protein